MHFLPANPSYCRCFNAPASVRAGWSITIAKHYGVNTAAGIWYNYSIPSLEQSDTNNVIVSWVLVGKHGSEARGRRHFTFKVTDPHDCVTLVCYGNFVPACLICSPSSTRSHLILSNMLTLSLQIYPNWTTPSLE